ncbi:MAG TPA: FliA/WhiG family RNA polymerase sigma factor [Pirellulales bacterium]|jgi:RNA polymerase sigma factor for flagellar operon FliA
MPTKPVRQLRHRELWEAYAASRGVDLRNRLIECYLPLVKVIATRIWARLPDSVELDDLVQEGVLGLVQAVEKFDLDRANCFGTYATTRIRGAVLDYLRSTDWAPRKLRSNIHKLERAAEKLEQQHGRRPTQDELAQQLKIGVKKLEKLLLQTAGGRVVSISDKPQSETGRGREATDGEAVADHRSGDPSLSIQSADTIRALLHGLSVRDRQIITEHYTRWRSIREIGKSLGLSESRTFEVHREILARIKERIASSGQLGDYLCKVGRALASRRGVRRERAA